MFDASVFLVSALVAALVDPRPRHVRIAVLDLLFQIVCGEPHEEEIARGNHDLTERCREAARQGLWILYRELLTGERDAARDVLEVIEHDSARLLTFLEKMP